METYINQVYDTFKTTTAFPVWQKLEAAAYPTYVVGGFLRNIALHAPVHDVDLATAATPEQIIAVFGPNNAELVGAHFGTVIVKMANSAVEVTTFRTESAYQNHRWPAVQFAKTIQDDLQRRDFTINAMAYRPGEGLIDPFLGYKDTRERVLCCVRNPVVRFEEDALRLLRGLRFAHQYDLMIEDKTRAAMQHHAHLLRGISAERIVAELDRLFAQGDTFRAFENGKQLCFWESMIPSWEPPTQPFHLEQDMPTETRVILQWAHALSTRPLVLVKQDMKRLRFSKAREHSVFYLLKNATCKWDNVTSAVLKQCMQDDGVSQLKLLLAYQMAMHNPFAHCVRQQIDRIIISREPYLRSHLAINGHDLERLGVQPRAMKEVFERLLSIVQNTPTMNTKEALTQWVIDNK